jgi:hypothetical protein
MNNRNTAILAVVTFVVLVGAIGIGIAVSTPPAPKQTPQPTATQQKSKSLSQSELASMLIDESPAINLALVSAVENVGDLYTVTSEKLYGDGKWYGAILIYKGTDENNRDTLRVLMQKKEGEWIVRTTPPRPLLNTVELPDVPKTILQDLNRPAPLPGTATSPAIN